MVWSVGLRDYWISVFRELINSNEGTRKRGEGIEQPASQPAGNWLLIMMRDRITVALSVCVSFSLSHLLPHSLYLSLSPLSISVSLFLLHSGTACDRALVPSRPRPRPANQNPIHEFLAQVQHHAELAQCVLTLTPEYILSQYGPHSMMLEKHTHSQYGHMT